MDVELEVLSNPIYSGDWVVVDIRLTALEPISFAWCGAQITGSSSIDPKWAISKSSLEARKPGLKDKIQSLLPWAGVEKTHMVRPFKDATSAPNSTASTPSFTARKTASGTSTPEGSLSRKRVDKGLRGSGRPSIASKRSSGLVGRKSDSTTRGSVSSAQASTSSTSSTSSPSLPIAPPGRTPLFASTPHSVFGETTLEAGMSKSVRMAVKLPPGLPPSFTGSVFAQVYSLYLGFGALSDSKSPAVIRVPLQVAQLPDLNSTGTEPMPVLPPHWPFSWSILDGDHPVNRAHGPLGGRLSTSSSRSSSSLLTNVSSSASLFRAGRVGSHGGGGGAAGGGLSGLPVPVRPKSVKAAVDALEELALSEGGPKGFVVAHGGDKIGVAHVTKTTVRAGDVVTGTLDFTSGARGVVRVAVRLVAEEFVSGAVDLTPGGMAAALTGPASDGTIAVAHHVVETVQLWTVGTRLMNWSLHVPPAGTGMPPSWSCENGGLRWLIMVDFVLDHAPNSVPQEALLNESGVRALTETDKLSVLSWSIPLLVLTPSDLPNMSRVSMTHLDPDLLS